MAWVETRITRTSQPQDACGIDWANPIALGLIGALSPKGDAVTNKTFQRQGTPTIAANATGLAVVGNGSSYIKSSIAPAVFTKSEVTLFYVGSVAFASNSIPASVSGSGGNQLFTFIFDASGNQNVVYRAANGGGSVSRRYDVFQPVGVFRWGATYDGTSDLKIYNNGDAVTANPTVNTLNNATPSGFDSVCLGGADRSSDLFQGSGGEANVVYAWNRALSAAEHKSLSENPWQIFEPEVSRIWVDDYVSAGGGGPTLTAPLLTNTSTFFAPIVTPGAVSATAPLLTNTSALFAPTISAGGTGLSAPLLTNSQTFFAPAVAPGEVTLTAPLFTNASALYTPAIVNGIVVSPPYFENANSFYSPTVTPGAVALAAALFTNTSTVFPARIVVAGDELTQILQILTNRQELNPDTGMFVLYDDDGVSVLKTALAWEDAAGTIPYRGQALRRLDALQ